MPGTHQITACVFAGAHQVPRRFLLNAGDGDLYDLTQMQQPGQMLGVTSIWF